MSITPERERQIIEELKQFDTPTITNVVASYPSDPEICLGLYHPWEGNWYTDFSIKCIYPELGRVCGYAVTCVYGLPDPRYTNLSLGSVLRSIGDSPKPVILAIKQDMPDHIKNRNGLSGGNMTTAFKSAGVVGVMSDGPSRDIDEIRPMGIQYLLTGVSPGHGDFAVKGVDVPVNICGMDVCTGDIIHMDENGAVKFPRKYLEEVLRRSHKLMTMEKKMQQRMRETTDVELLARIMEGFED